MSQMQIQVKFSSFRVSLKLQKTNGEIAQPLPVIWKELADL